jgi:hypothetical protein
MNHKSEIRPNPNWDNGPLLDDQGFQNVISRKNIHMRFWPPRWDKQDLPLPPRRQTPRITITNRLHLPMQPSQVGNPIQTRVVCASIRPSVTSDKVRVRTIRVNVLVTLDRVNLDLLCPRWLPHCYHVGWSGCCGRIRLAERRIRRWRGTYACVRGAYDRLWGA